MSAPTHAPLERRLGALDAALLTVGSVIGTGIFLTGGDVARAVGSPALVLAVWLMGGLLTLAGALTYAELGVLFPRAGGIYGYLREAYGPVWGFFYGWTSLLIIMSGGIAAIGFGFREYFGTFVPWFSSARPAFSLPLGAWTWSPNGAQVAGSLAILVLTAINHLGAGPGAATQNALTALKVGAMVLFMAFGFLAPAPAPGAAAPALIAPALGLGMIAAIWTYDGWYGLTFSAGELKNPSRTLPLGLIAGTLVVMTLYLGMNALYLRALPGGELAQGTRTAEDAARALFGAGGARLMSLAVALASFGCLSSTILYSSRIYHPMAEDGVFFRGVAAIDPRFRVPVRALWLQSGWAALLAMSGSYSQLFTWVTFAGILFHVACGISVFLLRARRPAAPRPYRVWGYPVVPALFVAGMAWLTASTLADSPRESLLGIAFIALGWPAYLAWTRRRRDAPAGTAK